MERLGALFKVAQVVQCMSRGLNPGEQSPEPVYFGAV